MRNPPAAATFVSMSLLDRLQNVADQLPPSHAVTTSNVTGILSALVLMVEHGGEDFLNAVEGAEEGVVGFLAQHAERQAQAEQPSEQPATPGQSQVGPSPAAPPSPAVGVGPIASAGQFAGNTITPPPAPVEPPAPSPAPSSAPFPWEDQGAEQPGAEPSYDQLRAQLEQANARLADLQRAQVAPATDPAGAEPYPTPGRDLP